MVPLAPANQNVVLAHSGWGDGNDPVVKTLDDNGNLLAIHIDLFVVGGGPDD